MPLLDSLTNHLLIAMPSLSKGIFKSSVTYICEHNEEGAMGIIINRPSNLSVQDILNDINNNHEQEEKELHEGGSEEFGLFDELPKDRAITSPVMVGGPVGLERGFVLHQTQAEDTNWESSLQVTEDIALTGSKDILQALGQGRGPQDYLVVLGYAGWDKGQLEQELAENVWISIPANKEILFSTPYHKRASAAVKTLGIDLASLATYGGNA